MLFQNDEERRYWRRRTGLNLMALHWGGRGPGHMGRRSHGGGGAVATTWATDAGNKAASITLSNGNLTATGDAAAGYENVRGTSSKTTGKHCFQVQVVNEFAGIGVGNATASLTNYVGSDAAASLSYWGSGFVSGGFSSIASYTAGDIILVALDADARTVRYFKNGSEVSPGGGYSIAGITGALFPMFGSDTGIAGSMTLNVNPASPPSGYSAWG